MLLQLFRVNGRFLSVRDSGAKFGGVVILVNKVQAWCSGKLFRQLGGMRVICCYINTSDQNAVKVCQKNDSSFHSPFTFVHMISSFSPSPPFISVIFLSFQSRPSQPNPHSVLSITTTYFSDQSIGMSDSPSLKFRILLFLLLSLPAASLLVFDPTPHKCRVMRKKLKVKTVL